MNTLRKGEVYQASKKRAGKTESKDWEMFTVVDERGHNGISVFVTNRPSGVEEGEHFRIDEIDSLTVKNRKDDNGNWWTDVSVNASITHVQGISQYLEKQSNVQENLDSNETALPF